MGKNNITFTDAQRRCAGEIGKSIAILAGAGSGKTAVLIERIKNIVLAGRAGLNEIVAITFTEKAAGELIYRLASEIPAKFKPQTDLATITTIDGFCTKILRENAAAAGVNPDFTVLEEHASQILIHRLVVDGLKEMLKYGDPHAERIVEEMDFRYAVSCLEDMIESRWRTCRWINTGHRSQAAGNGLDSREKELTKSLAQCFQKVLAELEEEKRSLGVLDFADLEIKTLEILQSSEELRKKRQSQIKHLLIDEYQDTSDLQTEIVKCLYNPKRNFLCIVGDPGQSIYRFRGANPEGIHTMKKLIEDNGGLSIELTDNFRSAEPVIGFVNKLFPRPRDTNKNYFMPLTSMVGQLPQAKVARINIDAEKLPIEEVREREASILASLLSELKASKKISYGEVAILFQSFTDIQIFEKALNKRRIPYYRSGGRTFLAQPEVADIILCLKAISDPANDTLAYGLARSSIIGLSDQECYKLITREFLRSRSGQASASPQNDKGDQNDKRNLLDILASDRRFGFLKRLLAVKGQLSIAELIREIVDLSHLHHVFEALLASGQSTANIEKFISLAENITSQYDYTLEEFLEYIDDLRARGIGIDEPPIFSPRDDAVKLLTVHAAKGLEFKIVILADLARADRHYNLPYIIGRRSQDTKNFEIGFKLVKGLNPLADKERTATFDEILKEEKEKEVLEKERLLYVAATRAKEMLILPMAKGLNCRSSWSRWILPMAAGLEAMDAATSETGADTEVRHIAAPSPYKGQLLARDITLTVSQLDSYHRCPQEYYLKYVMRLPAEKIDILGNKMGANTIGNIVHRLIYLTSITCHAGGSSAIPLPQNDRRDDLIRFVCREYGYTQPDPGDVAKIEKHLKTYENSKYHRSKLTEPRHEVPFVSKMNGAVIRGTIDCIFKDGGNYSIVDFKTDEINKKEDIQAKLEEYRLQTLAYAISAKKALAGEISKTALLFLNPGHAEEMELTPEHLEEGAELIGDIARAIRTNSFSIENRRTPCERCLYHYNEMCWLDK